MSNYPCKFGKYLLLERVNVGGMAEVFKAKTYGVAGFERILAIKRILPNLVEDDEFIRMFIDEARIAVQLNHTNIVQIYELGKHGEHYYIAMEYVPSRDLRAILDRMRSNGQLMPIPQAAYICKKVCEGLDYAHKKREPSGSPMNIIHRDVSPQNILLGFEGEVKVIDFGIAKAANRASKTQAGVLKGKFGYMSPEQVRGLPTDRRSDIFAVGVLLYEMLTGERLFIGESDFSTLERVRNAEVVPPTNFNKKITPALEQIVLKTLAREVEDRYQWASDLAEEIEPFLVEDKQVYSMKRLALVLKETRALQARRVPAHHARRSQARARRPARHVEHLAAARARDRPRRPRPHGAARVGRGRADSREQAPAAAPPFRRRRRGSRRGLWRGQDLRHRGERRGRGPAKPGHGGPAKAGHQSTAGAAHVVGVAAAAPDVGAERVGQAPGGRGTHQGAVHAEHHAAHRVEHRAQACGQARKHQRRLHGPGVALRRRRLRGRRLPHPRERREPVLRGR